MRHANWLPFVAGLMLFCGPVAASELSLGGGCIVEIPDSVTIVAQGRGFSFVQSDDQSAVHVSGNWEVGPSATLDTTEQSGFGKLGYTSRQLFSIAQTGFKSTATEHSKASAPPIVEVRVDLAMGSMRLLLTGGDMMKVFKGCEVVRIEFEKLSAVPSPGA